MLSDLSWKEQDGIYNWDNLKKLDQRKCSLFFLLYIAEHCQFHKKAKKINLFTNAHAIKLKIEEILMYSQPN